MSSCKQHCRRPLLKGSCFIVWLAQFCKPCLQGEYVYIIQDRNLIHPVYTFTLLFLVHPSSHPSICGSFSTYLLILLYLPLHLFAHVPIYLSNYFYIFSSNYRNTWIVSSQYVISSENGIKTHQHPKPPVAIFARSWFDRVFIFYFYLTNWFSLFPIYPTHHCQHFYVNCIFQNIQGSCQIPSSKIFIANISMSKFHLSLVFFSGNKPKNVAGDFPPGLLEH